LTDEDKIWKLLEEVPDPEIPVVSVVDLGVVRTVAVNPNGILIEITSTYSGCPATEVFIADIKSKLEENSFENVEVKMKYSPAWTTDWLTENARTKLRKYGIAPPEHEPDKSVLFANPIIVPCPRCNAKNTKMLSQFGSTACKSLYQCNECLESFDYFKCLK
tara:strand:- start:16699 stop:17184 length:486 start_codon:yes stop_codon:yes gene_type:complete